MNAYADCRLAHRNPRVHAELEQGRLAPVLHGWASAPRALFCVYASGRFMPLKLRALVDHVADKVRQQPDWFEN